MALLKSAPKLGKCKVTITLTATSLQYVSGKADILFPSLNFHPLAEPHLPSREKVSKLGNNANDKLVETTMKTIPST